jgi:hypothetical protein
MLRDLLPARERVLGSHHQHTLATRTLLARCQAESISVGERSRSTQTDSDTRSGSRRLTVSNSEVV